MSELKEIGKKYNTDKFRDDVNYTPAYEKYFSSIKNKNLKVLEIGVKHGAGLLTWKEYFRNSKIYGMDNWKKVSDYDNVTKHLNQEGINIFKGDQADINDLKELVELHGDFDIIIDDGGHTMMQQQLSFGALFKHLKPSGIYVVEDLVTSYWGFDRDQHKDFPSYFEDEDKITTLEYLKLLQKTGKSSNKFVSSEENLYIEENFKQCEVFEGTAVYHDRGKDWKAGIAMITKK